LKPIDDYRSHFCDICGGSLREEDDDYVAYITVPVSSEDSEGPHKIFKAIHIACYKPEKTQ
jgi:hypothetical protein